MWGWSVAIGSPGLWLTVGFLFWSILCSLAAFHVCKAAVRDRQGVRLTLSFFRGRVELETDPHGGPQSEHQPRVGEVLVHRRDQAAS